MFRIGCSFSIVPIAWLLLFLMQSVMGQGRCNFDNGCDWSWNSTQSNFTVVKAPISYPRSPRTDATNSTDGKFLWLTGPNEGQLKSRLISRAGLKCQLKVAFYQVEMEHGNITLIIETLNKDSSVTWEGHGNNNSEWETTRFNLAGLTQDFSIILEIKLPSENSFIGIDNIHLENCSRSDTCDETKFHCKNGWCYSRDHVCDLTVDCEGEGEGEDEAADCDKVPEYAKCNFESGWCGWERNLNKPLQWTLLKGLSMNKKRGPGADHTYDNETGTYAYVYTSGNKEYGTSGSIKSPIFNPTPPYHHNRSNPFYESCKIRFFYLHTMPLYLYLVQLKDHQNLSNSIWLSPINKAKSSEWVREVVKLPDTRYKYYFEFEATKTYDSLSYVAIDDISLSPECFGIGVPPSILGDFNYSNPKIPPSDLLPPKHIDFINGTIIQIGTCGQTGRIGPSPEKCAEFNNGTDVIVLSNSSTDKGDAMLRSKGIQRWTAPQDGFYTLIAMGARGGLGAPTKGSTLGAVVSGVIELDKGQHLYFMIGQPGTDACPKSFRSTNNKCQQSRITNYTNESSIRQVKNTKLKDGGGGGGGATYIFTLKENGEQQPLLIAGGGGGLGPTQLGDNNIQHGKGKLPRNKKPFDGESLKNNTGGGGGGWIPRPSNKTSHVVNGMSLSKGGIGGVGCGSTREGHGNGGFGGGGGGCLSGGGGGGYAGGDTGFQNLGNGEGGYSYASPELLYVTYTEKANAGPGEALIIPAIVGCDCQYRCVVIDQHQSETHCVCPREWRLGSDTKACVKRERDTGYNIALIFLICVSIAVVILISIFFFVLYNHYQKRKAKLRTRQVMCGNGTELTRLRVVSANMMTEFNPNYEFAGDPYIFEDLPQIPRDNITLVKPLGQGAFGEVFQGIYKYGPNEECPVAVKTLPSLSTSQVAEFLTEALIMSKFNHPNIVHLIGVSFDKHPQYIVLELLAGGDLKNFLREERPRPDRPTTLTMQNLIMCAYDVANGCKYMEDARFIHRDIAARNCLLTCKGPGRVVKIADFGMARDIYKEDYYRKGGKAMLPIKWMPPESFLDGIFTTKTDVWAFGVLLWEIMSFGYMPYTGCSNREVMSMVKNGGRLERPAGCPDPIYGIMTRCWHPHPQERPSFTNIIERIGYCLQDPDVINHPTPNCDILPICEREMTIMRPDPETECINVHADLDGCGYMQPRSNFQPGTYRIGQLPGLIYTLFKRSPEDCENSNNLYGMSSQERGESPPRDICDNRQHCENSPNAEDEPNANVPTSSSSHQALISTSNTSNDINNFVEQPTKLPPDGQNGNGESTTNTDVNSDTFFMPSSGTPPNTVSSTPNTRTSSPIHTATGAANNGNGSPNNSAIRKNALKAALSLNPSTLCSETIPYKKIAFSPPKPRLSNPGSMELRKDSLSHELPREEECSC